VQPDDPQTVSRRHRANRPPGGDLSPQEAPDGLKQGLSAAWSRWLEADQDAPAPHGAVDAECGGKLVQRRTRGKTAEIYLAVHRKVFGGQRSGVIGIKDRHCATVKRRPASFKRCLW
jgi:hypothetical protein